MISHRSRPKCVAEIQNDSTLFCQVFESTKPILDIQHDLFRVYEFSVFFSMSAIFFIHSFSISNYQVQFVGAFDFLNFWAVIVIHSSIYSQCHLSGSTVLCTHIASIFNSLSITVDGYSISHDEKIFHQFVHSCASNNLFIFICVADSHEFMQVRSLKTTSH